MAWCSRWQKTMNESRPFAPSRAATVTLVVLLRIMDLIAIALGGQNLAGSKSLLAGLYEGISNWDAHWYAGIAANGYSYTSGTDSNVAFFPGWPILMRVVSPLTGGNYVWAGLAISLVISYFAVLGSGKALEDDLGRAAARRTVILVSAVPSGFFFALPYADGILLLLCTASLMAARQGHWFRAGILAALAGTMRITGALLFIPLLWILCEQAGWSMLAVLRYPRRLLAILISFGGIGSYALWLHSTFGEPFAFFVAQLDGWPHRTTWFLRPIWDTLVELARPMRHLAGERPDLYWAYLLDIAMIITAATLFIVGVRKKLPAVYLLWWGIVLVLPIISGTTNSFARYSLLAFPMFGTAALLLKRRREFVGVVLVGAGIQLLLARAHGMGWWVG